MLLYWQRHLPQYPAADVRIHLRGAAAGVPRNLLNDPQVGSSLQKRCEARMPEAVEMVLGSKVLLNELIAAGG